MASVPAEVTGVCTSGCTRTGTCANGNAKYTCTVVASSSIGGFSHQLTTSVAGCVPAGYQPQVFIDNTLNTPGQVHVAVGYCIGKTCYYSEEEPGVVITPFGTQPYSPTPTATTASVVPTYSPAHTATSPVATIATIAPTAPSPTATVSAGKLIGIGVGIALATFGIGYLLTNPHVVRRLTTRR